MFTPRDRALDRGWPGRLDDDHVVQLAAQTLQSFFTGGGQAREHAVWPLSDVLFRAPVLHPPSVRIFEDTDTFAFANAAAIRHPDLEVTAPTGAHALRALTRPTAVIGADGEIGGFTTMTEWRAEGLAPPKDRDFALALGPLVVTPEEWDAHDDGFDWASAAAYAARGTVLRPGDLLAGPAGEAG
jgi:hypothetical protein